MNIFIWQPLDYIADDIAQQTYSMWLDRVANLVVLCASIAIVTTDVKVGTDDAIAQGRATLLLTLALLICFAAPFASISAYDIIEAWRFEESKLQYKHLELAISLKGLPLLTFLVPAFVLLAIGVKHETISTSIVACQLLFMSHLFSVNATTQDFEFPNRKELLLAQAVLLSLGYYSWSKCADRNKNDIWYLIGIICHTIAGCFIVWRLIDICRGYARSLSIVSFQPTSSEMSSVGNMTRHRVCALWNNIMLLALLFFNWLFTGLVVPCFNLTIWLNLLFWVTILR